MGADAGRYNLQNMADKTVGRLNVSFLLISDMTPLIHENEDSSVIESIMAGSKLAPAFQARSYGS